MKRITRSLVFSAVAIVLTALWNNGFQYSHNPKTFIIGIILLAIVFYLIVPITKLILLPLNILTLGLVSIVAYFLIFYFFVNRVNLIIIKPWNFAGIRWDGLAISKIHIGYLINVILSAISVSTIINLLEALL